MGEELRFIDNKLFVYTPLPQYGEGIYETRLVMTKEMFQECYKRWIKPRESRDIAYWIRWYKQKETKTSTEYILHCKCSKCGREYDPHLSQFIKFCSNCGAQMQEKSEDENDR